MYLSNIWKPPILARFRQQNRPEIQMAPTICLNSLSAPKALEILKRPPGG